MLKEYIFLHQNRALGFNVAQGFAVKMTQEAVDIVFALPPEIEVDLGYGDLAHELDVPFAEVCPETLVWLGRAELNNC